MKRSLGILPILTVFIYGHGLAQEVRTPPVTTVAALPAPIHDATPPEPRPPVEKPDFQIESTQVKLLDVVEAPPMPGLPPVEGTITLKVHSVANPGLPDPPQPPPARVPLDPEFLEHFAEEHLNTGFAFVSATVYDHSRTHLTCHPSGGGNKAITVWSNVDFNHFSGIGAFEATGADGKTRSYHLMMGIGNKNTEEWLEWLAEREIEWEMPEIPALPDAPPAFVIETQNPDPESVKLIEDLHALYRDEGEKMAADAAARQAAHEARKAHFLANPPKPKDVTIHFWNRKP